MKIPFETPTTIVEQHTTLEGIGVTWQVRDLDTPPTTILSCRKGRLLRSNRRDLIPRFYFPMPRTLRPATTTALITFVPLFLPFPVDHHIIGYAMLVQDLRDGGLQGLGLAILTPTTTH